MNIESIHGGTMTAPKVDEPIQQVQRTRQETQATPKQGGAEQSKVQAEELLGEIKSLTEDGLYSVRFEKNNDLQELVVKIVDQKTDEVVRQIPPEELINLTKHLRELQGNIVNTVS